MGLPWARKPEKSLEERVEKLEREVRGLKLDAEEVQEKVYRWMQRARQRTEVDKPAQGATGMSEAARRVLARRGMIPNNGGE